MEAELEDTGQVGTGKVSWTALAGFENILAETMTTDRRRTLSGKPLSLPAGPVDEV